MFPTGFAAGLVNVNVMSLCPFWGTVDGEKDLVNVGGPNTFKLAELLAAPADGVCIVVTPEVTFDLTPGELLVISKITVQEPLAGMVIPLKLKAVAPAESVPGEVPVHVPVTKPPAALMPVSVSVNDPLVRLVPFGFVSVRVTAETPPTGIFVGENTLLIEGGVISG